MKKGLIFSEIQNGCQRFNFFDTKQKLHIFRRLDWSVKSGAISTKIGQVIAIFPNFIIFKISKYEPNFLKITLILLAIANLW